MQVVNRLAFIMGAILVILKLCDLELEEQLHDHSHNPIPIQARASFCNNLEQYRNIIEAFNEQFSKNNQEELQWLFSKMLELFTNYQERILSGFKSIDDLHRAFNI